MNPHIRPSPETRNFLGRKELALMKPTAILASTGRGELVDCNAFLAPLKDRKIFGAQRPGRFSGSPARRRRG